MEMNQDTLEKMLGMNLKGMYYAFKTSLETHLTETVSYTHLDVYKRQILFILFTALVNLFMVSATAKWAFMSFIFVPVLASMGISPDMTCLLYTSRAYREVSLYKQGKAEASNNLGFCAFMRMDFEQAEKFHMDVYLSIIHICRGCRHQQ